MARSRQSSDTGRREFRRDPCVVCFWDDRRLVFANYRTGARIAAEPLAATVLHFFDRWRSLESLIAQFPEYTPASLRTAAGTLARHALLQRSDRPADVADAMGGWRSWNPEAGFFHFSTKDGTYAPAQRISRHLRQKARRSPPPPPVKRYRGHLQLELPRDRPAGEFADVLLARRTWRRFSRRPLALADLSTLLALTWKIHGWIELPGFGRAALKTSPSGGARHPIEVYVVARRVDGVAPGLYHYAADTHRLELLRRGASIRQLLRYLPTQWWFGPAPALMVMTAIFPRTQWKYEFPRAYRVVLADAGHLCQTFCLTATWLGLAPFCTMALADSKIERDLGVDGATESVIYVAGVGVRPSDGNPG